MGRPKYDKAICPACDGNNLKLLNGNNWKCLDCPQRGTLNDLGITSWTEARQYSDHFDKGLYIPDLPRKPLEDTEVERLAKGEE